MAGETTDEIPREILVLSHDMRGEKSGAKHCEQNGGRCGGYG